MQDGEISLFDLWEKLRDGWYYVVGGTVLGLAGAGTLILQSPPSYEAVAMVQVGQVGQVGQVTPMPVEPPAQAVERLRSSSFQLGVARSLGDQQWIDALTNSSGATTRHLSFQVMRNAPLIELKASANSPERAKTVAEATIRELARKQAEIAKPMIDRLLADLSIARDRLASAERELEGLGKMVVNASVKDERFTQLSLIASLRVLKEAEVFGQRQAIMAYESALRPPATQPAEALEAVFVASKPVSPKKSLLLALGLVGGLLSGVVMVFFVDAWRRASGERRRPAS